MLTRHLKNKKLAYPLSSAKLRLTMIYHSILDVYDLVEANDSRIVSLDNSGRLPATFDLADGLGRALLRNTHVQYLFLHLQNFGNRDYFHDLFDLLRTFRLRELVLADGRQSHAVLIREFLENIAPADNLRKLVLSRAYVDVPDLVNFLLTSQIHTLVLDECQLQNEFEGLGPSIAQNRSLSKLQIQWDVFSPNHAVLERLFQYRLSIQTLAITFDHGAFPESALDSLRQFLPRNPQLQTLVLHQLNDSSSQWNLDFPSHLRVVLSASQLHSEIVVGRGQTLRIRPTTTISDDCRLGLGHLELLDLADVPLTPIQIRNLAIDLQDPRSKVLGLHMTRAVLTPAFWSRLPSFTNLQRLSLEPNDTRPFTAAQRHALFLNRSLQVMEYGRRNQELPRLLECPPTKRLIPRLLVCAQPTHGGALNVFQCLRQFV